MFCLLSVFLLKIMIRRSIHLRNLRNMICEYKLSKNLSGHWTCCVNAEQTNFRWLANCCFYDNVNNPFSFRQHCFINKYLVLDTTGSISILFCYTILFIKTADARIKYKKSSQLERSIPFQECVALHCGLWHFVRFHLFLNLFKLEKFQMFLNINIYFQLCQTSYINVCIKWTK